MRENMLQQKEEGLATLAALGRNEDTYLAHVAPDEMIVPAQVLRDNPLLKTYVLNSISKYGVDPNKYIVGNGDMDLNPLTGLPEFGFLSKVFKKIKKVVKKVAPVAVNFIPGVGPVAKAALTAAAGKASGLSTRDALLAGATSFAGNKMFGGATPTGGSAATGNIFQRAKEYILPGQDKVGLFGNIRKGIGSFFGGPQPQLEMGDDGNYFDPVTGNKFTYDQLSEMGLIDRSGNLINSPLANLSNRGIGRFFGGTEGQSRLGTIEDFIKGRPSDPVRQGGFLEGVMGGTPGQSQIGMIEDTLRGRSSDPVRQGQQSGIGGLFGSLAGGNLTIPALYGLASYYGAKRDEGGLAATPATTMDQLGRYQIAQNLGTGGSREDFGLLPAPKALKFAAGGVAELDMRQGGESAGPGTGTSDDIPAMLSDGEFVMTAKATRGAGAYKVKTSKGGIELVKTSSPSREAGVKNMRKLMKTFEAV